MKRYIFALTLILIIIIIGLHEIGVAPFDYKGKSNGDFKAIIISSPEEKEYVDVYKAKAKNKIFLLCIKKNKSKIGKAMESTNSSKEKLEIGTLISFNGKFSKPSSQRNYGGFDYNLYLRSKGIKGIFNADSYTVLDNNINIRNEKETKNINDEQKEKNNNNDVNFIDKIEIFFLKNIEIVKNKIKDIYSRNLNKKNFALLSGLTIGDKTYIEDNIIENFRKASLSHILAISGAHFSYIILMTELIGKLSKRKRLSQVITIVIMIFFIELTGSTPSVIRAGLSAIIVIMASILKRKNDFLTTLSLTLLIQIIFNPLVIFDMGLILSYSGVIGIVYFFKIISKFIKSKTISVTLSANLIIIPIMMYNFNTISLSFLISNIFASFLLGPIVILGYVSIIFRFKFIFALLNFLLTILSKVAEITGNLKFSNLYVTTPNVFSLITYYFMIYKVYKYFRQQDRLEKLADLSELKKNKFILKKIMIICFVVIFITNINFQKFSNSLYINFIDVGQGDSCLIRNGGKTIIIDGGGANNVSSSYNVGKSTLLPYLLDRKVKKIDYMIFSHFDNDHCQGLIYLIEEIDVKNVIIGKQYENYSNYKKFKEAVKGKNIKIYEAKKGDILKINKSIEINVLWPDENNMISENAINNNSLVFKLKYKNFSMLFTGDIEKIAEEKILNEFDKGDMNVTILKVAHHGSKTSSTKNFVEAVNPKYALIGVGENNKFGHPSDSTIKSLKNKKIKIYRTDIMGEISIKITNNKIKIKKKLR